MTQLIREVTVLHPVVAETTHTIFFNADAHTTKPYTLYGYKHNHPTSHALWSHNKGPHSNTAAHMSLMMSSQGLDNEL